MLSLNPFTSGALPVDSSNMEDGEQPTTPMAVTHTHGTSPPDFTITCGHTTHLVHKHLLSSKSRFFRATCTGPFKESHQQTLSLPASDDPDLVSLLLDYIYHDTYTLQDDDEQEAPIVAHARMYALAEKYMLDGLKAAARSGFARVIITDAFTAREFAEAVRVVYASTVDGDRGLRDVVVRTMDGRPGMMEEEEVKGVVGEVGEVGLDLVMYRRGTGAVVSGWGAESGGGVGMGGCPRSFLRGGG
ncbi:hypothetical protein QBC39DRAFT_377372 [Podospora conica]|nr:hypothetical protein QBC39DRAFT_377372 [Schizothecium conicum]